MWSLLEQAKDNFFGGLVTINESCTHQYDPETKEMSKQSDSSTSRKPQEYSREQFLSDVLIRKLIGYDHQSFNRLPNNAFAYSSRGADEESKRIEF
ncbi:hypothetical protein TNCV_1097751 [Trichonephila clavipes]|nr:hypothetical protein TNCV_1097751 [Trichonephila clavipes]